MQNTTFIFFFYFFWAALGLCFCVWAFSSCGKQGLLFIVVCRLLIASLVVEHGLQEHRLQQLWHTGSVVVACGSRAQAQQLWRTGLLAPRHVGSSLTRARTRVPCTGRRILNHRATREAQISNFKSTDDYWKMLGNQPVKRGKDSSIYPAFPMCFRETKVDKGTVDQLIKEGMIGLEYQHFKGQI